MILEELKKILSWRKCLCLLAFGILYYLLFLKPYVYAYEGSYRQSVDLADAITEKYGDTISEEEYRQLKEDAPVRGVSEIDKLIAGNKLFQSYGFHTFREFNSAESLSSEESTALWMEIYDVFTADDVSEEFTRMVETDLYETYLEQYRSEVLGGADTTSYYENLDERQRQRVAGRNEEEVRGILPPLVVDNNFIVLQFWSVFVIISVIFMVLPYMVQENRNKMNMLQYSCKKGRKYYLDKLSACLISAFALIAAEFLIYLGIAKINCVTDFWNAPSASFASGYIGWFSWSLGKMTLMNVLFCAMVTVGAGLIFFVITGYCRNYITAIAWALPLVILAGCYGTFFANHFMEITKWKYMVPAVAAAVLGIGILSAGGQFLLERKKNIE